jgi:hydrogenase maturation factor
VSAADGPPQDCTASGEHRDGCATCSDAAVAMRVLALAPPLEPARCVGDDGEVAMVMLDLVEVEVGDQVLVHGGVAIGRTNGAERSP